MSHKKKKHTKTEKTDSVAVKAKPLVQPIVKPVVVPLAKPLVVPPKDTIAHSLFQNHLLPAKNSKSKIHITNHDYWVTGIFLFLYILFVWIYIFNRKKLNQIINGFYTSRLSNKLLRDEISIGNRVSFFLSIFFIITLALFISRVITYFGYPLLTENSGLFGLLTAAVLIISYTAKFAVVILLGYLFQVQREAKDYLMAILLFCNTLGLFMLPVVLCLTFVKQISPGIFIYLGIGIIITFILLRTARGLALGFKSSEISKFYLFMYLCTLEILPFIILVKFFMLKA